MILIELIFKKMSRSQMVFALQHYRVKNFRILPVQFSSPFQSAHPTFFYVNNSDLGEDNQQI